MMLYSNWLRLSIGTRHAIAAAFKIIKKNPTHVVDNYVQHDGYPIGDIESALTVSAMQEFTGSKSVVAEELFQAVVDKILMPHAQVEPATPAITIAPIVAPIPEVAPKKPKAKKK